MRVHWGFGRLNEEGFCEEVLDGLRSVTKTSDEEDYNEFVQRALSNAIGRAVKIADIRDNLDVIRINELLQKDMKRLN